VSGSHSVDSRSSAVDAYESNKGSSDMTMGKSIFDLRETKYR